MDRTRTTPAAALMMAALGTTMTLASCGFEVEAGCSEATPCDRGLMCDLETSECVPIDVDTDETRASAETFTDEKVPFFRGEVCMPIEVQAGTAFPVSMSPCLHPCLEPTRIEFKHSWACVGSSCEAFGVMWVEANSAAGGCPDDAFGRFPKRDCAYPQTANFKISPAYSDGTAIQGQMTFEVPFLTNDDIEEIASAGGDEATQMLIEDKRAQYPLDDNRFIGTPVSLLSGNPEPPESCDDGACDCFEIGF